MYNKEFEIKLRKEASAFIQGNYLLVNNIAIYLKEIEVYYHESGKFEDYTVHQNKLQRNNKHKFYVHRYGKEVDSPYKSSPKNNRGGCDFVVSDSDNIYYSYLIRSIVINKIPVFGPRKSLNAIIENTGLSYEELEKAEVKVMPFENNHDILKTTRIGLGKPTKDEESSFHKAELRLIVCDEYFKEKNGYKRRTEAVDNFLKEQLKNGKMTKAEAIKYSNDWFKAVSTWLKEYNADDKSISNTKPIVS